MINMTETETICGNKVPSSMAQVRISMKYTFLEYFRSRRFLIMLIITLLIAALLTIIVAWRRPAGFLISNLGFYSSWWGTASNPCNYTGWNFLRGRCHFR